MYLVSGVLAETDGSSRTLCLSSLEISSEGESWARSRKLVKAIPGGASLGVRSLSEGEPGRCFAGRGSRNFVKVNPGGSSLGVRLVRLRPYVLAHDSRA
eukprot:127701-Heterocapsa_arctica.AAC.1